MKPTALRRISTGALAVCVLAAWLDREQFLHSAFFAFVVWLSVTLGALAQLMVHHLTGGRWGFMVQRIFEAALAPLPALSLLFALVFAGTPTLWHGTGYFRPAWVIARAALCFAAWFWLAWVLRSRSLEQDRRTDVGPTRTLRALSGPGLVVYFLTVSFALLDWLMELEPGWRSTMFPVIMIATQTLLALSGATVAAVFLLPFQEQSVEQLATTQGWHDLGKLLFAFVIFWTYVAFAQFLIIWCGNLPMETVWYLHRNANGWQWLARGIAVVCFIGPVAVLLFQAPKKNRHALALVAGVIWISQLVYLFWVVTPAFFAAFHVSWMDFLIPLAFGAVWASYFWQAWSMAAAIPLRDPRLLELGVSAA